MNVILLSTKHVTFSLFQKKNNNLGGLARESLPWACIILPDSFGRFSIADGKKEISILSSFPSHFILQPRSRHIELTRN